MRELGDMDEAAIIKARVAACLALWVEQAEGADGPLVGEASTEEDTGQRIETLRPGQILYGRFGEKATPVSPARDDSYGPFYTKQQEMIAAGVDMFYAQLTGDLSSVNYSSFRAGDRDFRNAIQVFRWSFIIPMLLRPWWRRFIDSLVVQRKLSRPAYGVNWTPPKFMSVDPYKDAQADELRLSTGTQHLFDSIAEQGVEPRKHLRKQAEIRKLLDELGLDFAWMQGETNGQGNTSNSETGTTLQPGAGDGGPGKPNGRGAVL
jgi:capsid protein